MKSLRTIVVSIEPPLPFGHAVGRWSYVLLKGLVERGHQVTAFVTCGVPDEIAKSQELFPAPQYDVRAFMRATSPGGLRERANAGLRPNSRLFNEDLRIELRRELARGFDVLHLDQTWAGWLGLDWREKALLHILNLYEIDSIDGSRSLVARIGNGMLLRAERTIIRSYKTISTLTPPLTNRVRDLCPSAKVATVPLGLDLSLYEFRNDPRVNLAPVLGLIGSFQWAPTYSAGKHLLTRLWPEIKRRVPAARLSIVGHNARAVASLVSTPDVTIHDDVPDVVPFFREIDTMLYAPHFGSGMKVKVLEAFALGTSVVTTSDGIEGIPAMDGKHAGICEDDIGLIDRSIYLLTNVDARIAQRQEARRLVEDHCSPASTVGAIERIHREIASRRASSA